MTESNIQSLLENQARPYIELIDGLRTSNIQFSVQLPRIVVVGDQSSGKSSVLENLSGIEFPRGATFTTRCATEVRMSKVPQPNFWEATIYTTADMSNKQVLRHRSEVGPAIQMFTDTLCERRSISSSSIIIEVRASDTPDLTIIDTPGIIITPTTEHGPNVREDVKRLIGSLITEAETIILAVLPANQDLATTSTLEFVREFDPDGERTVGVLTKADKVDEGAEAETIIPILMNRRRPLALGYVAVCNRSQQDVMDRTSLQDARRREMEIFQSRPGYRNLVRDPRTKNLFGMDNLTKKLTDVLVERIKLALPKLTHEIKRRLHEVRKDEKIYGTQPTPERQKAYLDQRVNTFNKLLEAAVVQGKYAREPLRGNWVTGDDQEHMDDKKALRFVPRLRGAFKEFKAKVKEVFPNFSDDVFKQEILVRSKQSETHQLGGFLNYNFFQELSVDYVEKTKQDAMTLLGTASDFLKEIVSVLIKRQPELFSRFPTLATTIEGEAGEIIYALFNEGVEQIEREYEFEYTAFTLSDEYSRRVNEVEARFPALTNQSAANATSEQGRIAVQEFTEKRDNAKLIQCLEIYMDIQMDRLVDNVCRTILCHVTNQFPGLWFSRMLDVIQIKGIPDIMAEDNMVITRRQEVQEELTALEDAQQRVNQLSI